MTLTLYLCWCKERANRTSYKIAVFYMRFDFVCVFLWSESEAVPEETCQLFPL